MTMIKLLLTGRQVQTSFVYFLRVLAALQTLSFSLLKANQEWQKT